MRRHKCLKMNSSTLSSSEQTSRACFVLSGSSAHHIRVEYSLATSQTIDYCELCFKFGSLQIITRILKTHHLYFRLIN